MPNWQLVTMCPLRTTGGGELAVQASELRFVPRLFYRAQALLLFCPINRFPSPLLAVGNVSVNRN
jgi:hypothetical protein